LTIRPTNDEGREQWGDFEIAIAGMTHVGRIRTVNQDAFDRFDDPERGEILLVVADGLGGHRGGEVASRIAVGTLGQLCIESEGDARTRLALAIERANAEIHRRATKNRDLKGMGTTVVAVLLRRGGPAVVAHVGDSRLYRLRDGQLAALTEDHSVVQLLLRDGAITPEEALEHPKRNQILRALGVHDETEPDLAELDVEIGDTLLLCSDGLYGMLPEDDLKALAERAPDPHTAVAWMIDAANQAGGSDNITAVVASLHAPSDASGSSASRE